MSEPLRGVVVSHAALAEALVSAVRTISGVDGVLEAVSNEGCDPEALAARIDKALGKWPAVLFVDLPGGSCLTSALRMSRGRPTVAIVTGVNLAMLLDFVFHRDLSPTEAAHRAAQAGGNAIRTPGAPAAPAAPAA
jgi:mannose/fructose-specific phosphotransferase system component IIA